jgi:LacI family transcriptional regulator
MLYLKENNIQIPKQMGVAAFGNDPTAAIIEPGLTAFDQQPFKLGELAMQELLTQLIDGANYHVNTKVIEGELIVRNSTLLKGVAIF